MKNQIHLQSKMYEWFDIINEKKYYSSECLKMIIKQKGQWYPSKVIQAGLYKENNTNSTKESFDTIKRYL